MILLDCALRQIHDRKLDQQPPTPSSGPASAEESVAKSVAGALAVLNQIAKPRIVRSALKQAYGNGDAVTDELVDLLLAPAP